MTTLHAPIRALLRAVAPFALIVAGLFGVLRYVLDLHPDVIGHLAPAAAVLAVGLVALVRRLWAQNYLEPADEQAARHAAQRRRPAAVEGRNARRRELTR
jgi:hypothetical protein